MSGQWASGNQNVQILGVGAGSTIQISFGGHRRTIPIEPALVPVAGPLRSPARLIRARSGVVPYVARPEVLEEMLSWAQTKHVFAGYVVGGRGGSGKTRLAVELCERAGAAGWLAGILSSSTDAAAMEALIEAPTPRLVVIDYAENRAEQLETILPMLAAGASEQYPTRLLLLVRAAPRRSRDWTESLRGHGDRLDAMLDGMDQLALEDSPLEIADRQRLYQAAAEAFVARSEPPPSGTANLSAALDMPIFGNPLLIAVAAYLAVQDDNADLTTRANLLEELVSHEDRYWRSTVPGSDTDRVLRERVVALATLAGADSEAEAVELLALVPDLADARVERRAQLARWAHSLYPGPRWWNPLEPDLIGEHLVASCYTDNQLVLGAVLERDHPNAIIQPLDTYTRAVADHPELARTLSPVLSDRITHLCTMATAQATAERDFNLLLGGRTLADALERSVSVIDLKPEALTNALDSLPRRNDLILGPLALTISTQVVAHLRQLTLATPTAPNESDLFWSMNMLGQRLAEAGRFAEAVATLEELVTMRRQRAAENPAKYEPGLAGSLSNLSNRLDEVGRPHEALAAIQEAAEIYSRRVISDPSLQERHAGALINLSNRLATFEEHEKALDAIRDAVPICRQLTAANPALHTQNMALSLSILSVRLDAVGLEAEALTAGEEAISIARQLASMNPAAHTPQLALSLNNQSNRLAANGRKDEALAASKEAVALHRKLAMVNPAIYEPILATSLMNLSDRLAALSLVDDALAAIREAIHIGRRLATNNPGAYLADLARALNTLSLRRIEASQDPAPSTQEAVGVLRQLSAINPAYEPQLCMTLHNLASELAAVGRLADSRAAIGEAVDRYRRLSEADHDAALGKLLDDHAAQLAAEKPNNAW